MHILHAWNVSKTEAIQIQTQLAKLVITEDQLSDIKYVAGIDVGYDEQTKKQVAAIVVLDAQSLQVIDSSQVKSVISFPYIRGLLSFRELPGVLQALAQLKVKPDLIVCDGQGIAHPRHLGIASHLGVLCNIPTIGCGKTKLIGTYQEPSNIRGAQEPLIHKGEIIGSVLKTQNKVKPVFVSVGHRISLQTACQWILKLSPRYRLPETTRLAHRMVRNVIQEI
ncbi:MAG TPA: deoxyribonuclease V [Candidatus Babeliales bacterium]|jgi:deoxyribonuclease V|nr:deoxyribonuclease V [Candidatus Babeliales bacterium]